MLSDFARAVQTSLAQPKFTFLGDYNYVLNKPLNGVFALTPDKRLAVTLTSVTSPSVGGQITSFDPITGVKFDTEFVGSGPLEVDVVAVADGYRVAVLISQGGPRAVKIYDMNQSGVLTFRAQTQLTDSGADSGSNLVLSTSGQVGFTRVIFQGNSSQLVSFSLNDGSILDRINTFESANIKLYEDSTRRLIAASSIDFNTLGRRVVFFDAENPSQLQNLGQVNLPGTAFTFELEFTADGNYLFAGGSELSVINTSTRQVVSSLKNYNAQKIRISESNGSRLLAITPGATNGIALINADNLSNLQVINEISFSTTDPRLRDFTFSINGKRLFLNTDIGIQASSVPGLTTVWENVLPVSLGFRIETFGQPERIIGAWGSNNNFTATIYSLPNRTNRRVNFDADSKTDIGVFRPSIGTWYWLNSSNNNFRGFQFGQEGDIPVAADYDGDGQTDFGVYRPGKGVWYIFESSTNSVRSLQFGLSSDEPAQGDYDGDGKVDIAVFRRNPNRWYVIRSSDGKLMIRKLSGARAKPVLGDYDGDGKDDFVGFYSSGQWQAINSSSGNSTFQQFGQPGDIPLSGDWDGDGKSDLAVFRPSNGFWYIQQSFYGFRAIQFGLSTDIPVPADYDGDGNTDIAVFRPTNATWYILQSASQNTFGGGFKAVQFGLGTDIPLASRY